MNPVLALPFICIPLITTTISYFAVKFGLVNGFVLNVTWTLPAPIGAFLSTGNDWRAVVLVVINILVALALYYPFVKAYDNTLIKQEQEEMATES